MPLTRCSSLQNPPEYEDGTLVTRADGSPIEREYFDVRGYDLVSAKDWPLWLLTFTWPLIFLVIALISPSNANSKSAMAVEALLLTFSSFQIGYLIYHSDGIRYGAYFSYSGIVIYVVALVAQARGATPNNSFKPRPLRGSA